LTHQLHDLRGASEPDQQAEREHLQILADDALGMQTALHLDGNRPCVYPGLAAYDALGAIEASLSKSEKKGGS
jgi:hypothetical protein